MFDKNRIIAQANAAYGAILDALWTFWVVATEVALYRTPQLASLILAHGNAWSFELASFNALSASNATIFYDVDDVGIGINLHCHIFFGASIVAGVVVALLARENGMHKITSAQINANSCIARASESLMGESAHDRAGLTSSAKRVLLGILDNMVAVSFHGFSFFQWFEYSHPFYMFQ